MPSPGIRRRAARKAGARAHPPGGPRPRLGVVPEVVTGEAPNTGSEALRPQGRLIAWASVNMIVLRDAGGNTDANARDDRGHHGAQGVGGRRRPPQRRAGRRARIQSQIFEGSRDAVFLSDVEGRFVAVSHVAEELTGYSRAELLAMGIPQFLRRRRSRAVPRSFHAPHPRGRADPLGGGRPPERTGRRSRWSSATAGS